MYHIVGKRRCGDLEHEKNRYGTYVASFLIPAKGGQESAESNEDIYTKERRYCSSKWVNVGRLDLSPVPPSRKLGEIVLTDLERKKSEKCDHTIVTRN